MAKAPLELPPAQVARPSSEFLLGSEVLAARGFRELRGKRVGLITNPSGVNRKGISTIELLQKAPGIKLVALLGPEHGIYGNARAGVKVPDQRDPRTGLPVYSLYGSTRKPTPQMLKGLDCLVYDLQDIGCRSYTFISTLGLAMEACAEAGVEFVVLDRPNPLGGVRVEGPMLNPAFRSFVGQWEIPYVYGMTCGELARMIQGERWIKPAKLTVVPMNGWRREMTWRTTGLKWIPPSPRIPHPESSAYYASTGILGEMGGINIGMTLNHPFELISAPWLKADGLLRALNQYPLRGVRFVPFSSVVGAAPQQGVQIQFTDLAHAPLAAINIYAWEAIKRSSGRDLFAEASKRKKDFAMFDKITGSDTTRKQLLSRTSASAIVESWKAGEEQFLRKREKYLLY